MIGHVHRTHRSGWLRAAVLGANDGLLSMSSLMVGVAAAQAHPRGILAAGVAGLVAGMLSMGVGEYVSVNSQADAERADLDIERLALKNAFAEEQAELADIYVRRGLDTGLAAQVAAQLMAFDALAAHARDDIGISEAQSARPVLAAFTSCASFAAGGLGPVLAAFAVPGPSLIAALCVLSIVILTALGVVAARLGGAPVVPAALRMLAGGAFVIAGTGLVGALFRAIA